MKIAFLHDWTMPLNEYLDNEDGLPRAVEVLAEKHQVEWYTGGPSLTFRHKGYILNVVPSELELALKLHAQAPDIIVCWGSLDRPWHKLVHEQFPGTPKVLCFAGGPREHIAKSYFRVIVVESQVYLDDFTKAGVAAMRGFGTNTKVFRSLGLPKVWHAIYPASFCFHKNIELFARAMGGNGLVVGNHNEVTIVSKLRQIGTPHMHRVSSEALCDLYNMSHCAVITGGPNGGAQRIVLEAMACGIPVVVMRDNDKCVEFVLESGFGKICHPIDIEIQAAVQELLDSPPDKMIGVEYVKSKWSEYQYADFLMRAFEKALLN